MAPFPANLLFGVVSMPPNSRVLENSPFRHRRQVWRERQTLFRMKSLSGVHLRARTCASPRQVEPSRETKYPWRGTLILDTSYPKRSSRPARKRNVRRGAARAPESCLRAGQHALQRSVAREHAHTNIYDKFGASGKRFFV